MAILEVSANQSYKSEYRKTQKIHCKKIPNNNRYEVILTKPREQI